MKASDRIQAPLCSSHREHRNVCMLTLRDEGQNLTSSQGHLVSQAHVTYQSMRPREGNALGPSPVAAIFILSKVRDKKITSYDLE